MRKVLLLLAFALSAGASAFGANCAPGFFLSYAACDIVSASGTINFSNFTLDNNFIIGTGSGVRVPDQDLYVTPFGAGGYTVGFTISARDASTLSPINFFVTNTQQYVLGIRYAANAPGARLIGSTVASVNATSTCALYNTTVNCGSTSVTKDIFNVIPAPGPNDPNQPSPVVSVNVNDLQVTSPQAGFNLPAFGVRDTVTVQANHATATMLSFSNEFQTPEPATLGLAGVAFVGLALIRRRKRF